MALSYWQQGLLLVLTIALPIFLYALHLKAPLERRLETWPPKKGRSVQMWWYNIRLQWSWLWNQNFHQKVLNDFKSISIFSPWIVTSKHIASYAAATGHRLDEEESVPLTFPLVATEGLIKQILGHSSFPVPVYEVIPLSVTISTTAAYCSKSSKNHVRVALSKQVLTTSGLEVTFVSEIIQDDLSVIWTSTSVFRVPCKTSSSISIPPPTVFKLNEDLLTECTMAREQIPIRMSCLPECIREMKKIGGSPVRPVGMWSCIKVRILSYLYPIPHSWSLAIAASLITKQDLMPPLSDRPVSLHCVFFPDAVADNRTTLASRICVPIQFESSGCDDASGPVTFEIQRCDGESAVLATGYVV